MFMSLQLSLAAWKPKLKLNLALLCISPTNSPPCASSSNHSRLTKPYFAFPNPTPPNASMFQAEAVVNWQLAYALLSLAQLSPSMFFSYSYSKYLPPPSLKKIIMYLVCGTKEYHTKLCKAMQAHLGCTRPCMTIKIIKTSSAGSATLGDTS